LVIPTINLDAPIIPVSYKEITAGNQVYYQWLGPDQFAVGWHASSALLGLPGNTVFNGHHNAFGMVFKDLVKLETGDVISVYSGSQEFRYQVDANMLLPESYEPLSTRIENARWIEPSMDERITLVTCWPADNNTHRVVIVAFPISNSDINPIP
jgi:sortase A